MPRSQAGHRNRRRVSFPHAGPPSGTRAGALDLEPERFLYTQKSLDIFEERLMAVEERLAALEQRTFGQPRGSDA